VKLHERRLTVAHLLFGRADTASIAASFLTPPFCPQMRAVCFWRFHFSALFFFGVNTTKPHQKNGFCGQFFNFWSMAEFLSAEFIRRL
jgi:hypothetical protein